jgi:hypothetical protein
MKKRKSSIKKLKPKKKQRSAVELHKVLPTLKLVEDKKPEKKRNKNGIRAITGRIRTYYINAV